MKILVIGGTYFVGRHLVQKALAQGHEVTLFNRGKKANVFPNVEQLHSDRDKDVSVLKDKSFDAVIDTCAYIPRHVEMLTDVLDTKRFVFISTISVYADPIPPYAAEGAPLAKLVEPTEEITNEGYGGLKVLWLQSPSRMRSLFVLVLLWVQKITQTVFLTGFGVPRKVVTCSCHQWIYPYNL
ncbi:MAG: NAD-dependent epimerase/dehydratase family protein [Trueperaceae bacterium]